MAAFKFFLVVLALICATSAVPVEYQGYNSAPVLVKSYAPVAAVKTVINPGYNQVGYQHEAPAEYDFSYAVHDEHTGDIKSQQESRKGDVVQGRYELIEADGYKRIVEYTADDHSGFNAVVHREPLNAKVAVPQYQKIVAPVAKFAYSAPVAKLSYGSGPVAYSSPIHNVITPVTQQAAHYY